MPTEITDLDQFNQQLAAAGDKAVLVDFHAQWCGPCKMIAPFLSDLAEKIGSVVVLKVDVDEAEDVAAEHKIECMPTFIVFQNGKEVERFSGASKDKVQAVFDKYK